MSRIVCCGSNKFYNEIDKIMNSFVGRMTLEQLIETPIVMPAYCDIPKEEMTDDHYKQLLYGHFKEIMNIDSKIFIFDFNGYVGTSTAMEIAFARAFNKYIIGLCPPEDPSIKFIFDDKTK